MAEQVASDADSRTTAIGLFNTARSYWQSGVHLAALNLNLTHPSAPVTFMLCHAIELYLKAYLRGHGSRSSRHRASIVEAGPKAKERGLAVDDEGQEILSHINDDDVAIEARYIVTGVKSLPTQEALGGVCKQLDQKLVRRYGRKASPFVMKNFSSPHGDTKH